jgi:hemolysin III
VRCQFATHSFCFSLTHMTLQRNLPKDPQTFGEEIANSISHGLAFLLAIIASPMLMATAWSRGTMEFIGATIFVATVLLLYLASTLYHAIPASKAKQILHIFDHAGIFLLIAGTYTPFTLGVLRGGWGWTLLTLIWLLASGGIIMTVVSRVGYPRLAVALYLGMGWLILIAIWPLWLAMPFAGLLWLVAGGLAYTVGVVFYAAHGLPYSHFIWHLFVIAGTSCHFMAVYYAG